MKRVFTLLAILIASLLLAMPASGSQRWVVDDDKLDCPDADFTTIQAAVDAASPGDRIVVCEGTYHERVLITKNDLTLRGKDVDEVVVDADHLGNGITINGASGVTIESFTVRHGHDNDIMLVNANRNTIRGNVLTDAAHDGIELVSSDENVIERNLVIDNLAANACGINLSGGSDRNVVRRNALENNEWGIQISGSMDNAIVRNETTANRGNGIRNIGGSSGTRIIGNEVGDNGHNPSALTGTTNAGIRIASGTGIVVARNSAFGNLTVDIRQEDAAQATFRDNQCDTSSPDGLCVRDDEDQDDDD